LFYSFSRFSRFGAGRSASLAGGARIAPFITPSDMAQLLKKWHKVRRENEEAGDRFI